VSAPDETPRLLSISNSATDAMRSHLANAYPLEGCGVLIGRCSDPQHIDIHRAIGTRNSERNRGEDRYSIDPFDYRAIEHRLRTANDGTRIVGFFHSHPDAPARPSSVDLEMAQGLFEVTREYSVYAIVSVSGGSALNATFWQLASDVSHFIEMNAAS
jgi:proteasome lid subunit RPN8/RPN11